MPRRGLLLFDAHFLGRVADWVRKHIHFNVNEESALIAASVLNPFIRILGYYNSETGTFEGGTLGGLIPHALSIFGRTITLSARTIGLIVGFIILVGLVLIWGILSGILGGFASRGFRGATRPSGALAAVMLRLIAEDVARIAHLLGQMIGSAAVTLFGYILLFLGLKGSLPRG